MTLRASARTFAYTVDGGPPNMLNYECFNACGAEVTVKGVNVHPGSSKNIMKNAALIATEFAALLPPAETPAHTEHREGFYHLTSIAGRKPWRRSSIFSAITTAQSSRHASSACAIPPRF